MCGAILCAFRLVGHVRQSPHLGGETAVLLWPLKPRTHSQATTGQHRPVRTQHNRKAALLTGKVLASDQMLRGCVWMYIYASVFPPKTKPQRDGCQLVGGLMGVGWRDEGWGLERWTWAVRVEWKTMNWQLVFYFFLLQSLNPWHFGQTLSQLF